MDHKFCHNIVKVAVDPYQIAKLPAFARWLITYINYRIMCLSSYYQKTT